MGLAVGCDDGDVEEASLDDENGHNEKEEDEAVGPLVDMFFRLSSSFSCVKTSFFW